MSTKECPHCKAEMNEDSKFCKNCGYEIVDNIDNNASLSVGQIKNEVNKTHNINYLLLVAGILAIILSFVCFAKDTGSRTSYVTYGGDAYTGIQQASADSSNNIKKLAEIEKFGFGSILLVSGCTLVTVSFKKVE